VFSFQSAPKSGSGRLSILTTKIISFSLGQFSSSAKGETLEKVFMIFLINQGMMDFQRQVPIQWVMEPR
jgi:hypothetical protein